MNVFTKAALIQKLQAIRAQGWIANARPGNDGGIGNTLEDLLGIEENNLPLPNAAEWELKSHRIGSRALVTLFHMEPSPRALRFVPSILLPNYGWPHRWAGEKYPPDEMSFRQTISAARRSDRGFQVAVDRENQKVLVSFDANAVASEYAEWLALVQRRVGLGEISPQPYWGFRDLEHKAGTKLLNCFYVQAETRRKNGRLYFRYSKIFILQEFSLEGLLRGLEEGFVFVDFDARTGHNHGTKFRIRSDKFTHLYRKVIEL
jgi:hypothetical protein